MSGSLGGKEQTSSVTRWRSGSLGDSASATVAGKERGGCELTLWSVEGGGAESESGKALRWGLGTFVVATGPPFMTHVVA